MRTLPPVLRRRALEQKFQRMVSAQQKETQPGDVSPALKRRMGDDISEMFEEAGRSLYKKVVESLKDVLRDHFNEAIPQLDSDLKREGGRRWQNAAAEFYRSWINDMVETIVTQGMNEASGTLEDVASSYAAEQSAPDDEEGDEEGDSLIEVPVEETEEVEEVDVAPAEEEEEPTEDEEEMDLEELLAASVLPRTIRRPRPHRRRVQADGRGMPEVREHRLPTNNPSVEESVPPFVQDIVDALLGGLEEEFRNQITSIKIGLDEKTHEPWALVSAPTWNVDVLYDDVKDVYDSVASVWGDIPKSERDESWTFTDETTAEMGKTLATWLNRVLQEERRGPVSNTTGWERL